MYDSVWHLPQDQFVEVWNAAASLAEAAERMKQLAGGSVPRWAALARAGQLRKEGIAMKELRSVVQEKPPAL